MAGNRRYDFEVVGEAAYQDALSEICGGPCEEGHDFRCEARLVPEPDNKYDKNAVRVEVQGRTVAYLARADALKHNAELARLGMVGRAIRCKARINGGWARSRGRDGHFGVELNLARALRLAD